MDTRLQLPFGPVLRASLAVGRLKWSRDATVIFNDGRSVSPSALFVTQCILEASSASPAVVSRQTTATFPPTAEVCLTTRLPFVFFSISLHLFFQTVNKEQNEPKEAQGCFSSVKDETKKDQFSTQHQTPSFTTELSCLYMRSNDSYS